jgi:hypothetical protein
MSYIQKIEDTEDMLREMRNILKYTFVSVNVLLGENHFQEVIFINKVNH